MRERNGHPRKLRLRRRLPEPAGATVFGIDFSAQMVAVARKLNPDLEPRVEDIRHLSASDASLAGIVLFYAIVHFELAELEPVFREARRVRGHRGDSP